MDESFFILLIHGRGRAKQKECRGLFPSLPFDSAIIAIGSLWKWKESRVWFLFINLGRTPSSTGLCVSNWGSETRPPSVAITTPPFHRLNRLMSPSPLGNQRYADFLIAHGQFFSWNASTSSFIAANWPMYSTAEFFSGNSRHFVSRWPPVRLQSVMKFLAMLTLLRVCRDIDCTLRAKEECVGQPCSCPGRFLLGHVCLRVCMCVLALRIQWPFRPPYYGL